MKKQIISIVAVIGRNRELGKNNRLLWHIPQDLKRFKQLTENHAVIMGRKTFESIGEPLPNRINIVITRDVKKFSKSKIVLDSRLRGNDNTALNVVSSLGEAILQVTSSEVFIIGGGQIYEQAIKIADKLYLTVVTPLNSVGKIESDTFFPDYSAFNKVISKKNLTTVKYKLTFLELERA